MLNKLKSFQLIISLVHKNKFCLISSFTESFFLLNNFFKLIFITLKIPTFKNDSEPYLLPIL